MSTIERSRREKMLADETDIYEQWFTLRKKYGHIFDSPNSVRAEQTLNKILQQAVPGKSVLEIGCGTGWYTVQLTNFGASYVLGTDISERRIAQAKQSELTDLRDYTVADLSEPLGGYFDIIVGRAILHHLNYQEVMQRLYCDNLREQGLMLFYEPLGSNWLMRLFRRVSRNAHTLDERAFYRRDLRWLQKAFPEFTMIPVNYLSLPLGVVSSFLFENPNNLLLRFADRVDSLLARHFPWLHPQFRLAIFIIHKP
jgi:2-polyprenyl-3-methyl-5-hydroxy-6-metoxy-1,4-benzoquinol methylase